MTQDGVSLRAWVCRLWVVGLVQEGVEAWVQTWLVRHFQSPFMCRVSIRDDRWCMVPSLTQTMMSRLPAWKCVYDPWCDAVVYRETSPPLLTRLTVLTTALTVSLALVWGPRLLTYRPTKPLLLWARRNTPRRVLVLVAMAAVLQLLLDHWLFFLLLPPHLILTRLASFFAFCCALLVATGVLVAQLRHQRRASQHHRHHQYYLSEREAPQVPDAPEIEPECALPSTLPEMCRYLLTKMVH
ncbi:uncharacterized protein [Panulirus ornatus]|uniref:uncharacterized protein n=1 Tax=Panulirus ornatus TaxID=150431 RepID=UPI003A8865BC